MTHIQVSKKDFNVGFKSKAKKCNPIDCEGINYVR